MKKPEMEIVKFHNEDVIATSKWSEHAIKLVAEQHSWGGYDNESIISTNSVAWNDHFTDISKQVYSNSNTLDGKPMLDLGDTRFDDVAVVYYHYDLDSLVGEFEMGDYHHRVYSNWKTCTDLTHHAN